MSSGARDDFSKEIKRTTAERAAYICCNPKCRTPTVGPHSDPQKSLKTGIAAHICAAASGGPRYDPNQTPGERGGIGNAIWLCAACSSLIDKDPTKHPIELLFEWKRRHEEWIETGGIVPSLPELTLSLVRGRTLPDHPSTITGIDCENFREHSFVLRNGADAELLMIDARVQVPESITESVLHHKPVGAALIWEPIRPRMVAHVKGHATVTQTGAPRPTSVYHLAIDCLPPSHQIEIGFATSTEIHAHDLSTGVGLPTGFTEPPNVQTFVDGTFQFRYQGATLTKQFFAPIRYDEAIRQFSIVEVRGDFGEWEPHYLTLFW